MITSVSAKVRVHHPKVRVRAGARFSTRVSVKVRVRAASRVTSIPTPENVPAS